jgi:hypothetical protein
MKYYGQNVKFYGFSPGGNDANVEFLEGFDILREQAQSGVLGWLSEM